MKKYPEINRLKRLFSQYKKAALIEINNHITKNGYITDIQDSYKFNFLYSDEDGTTHSSHYSKICLDKNGNLEVHLSNGVVIPEKRLNIKHIDDILFIIDFDLATYQQP